MTVGGDLSRAGAPPVEDGAGTPNPQRPMHWGWVVLSAFAFAGFAIVVYSAFIGWFLFSGKGPTHASEPPPAEFERMTTLANAQVADTRFESLGGFIDTAYAWRIPVERSRIASIVAEFGLEPVSPGKVPSEFGRMFPDEWAPRVDAEDRAFASPEFSATERGPDGSQFLVVWDATAGQLYVWDKANF